MTESGRTPIDVNLMVQVRDVIVKNPVALRKWTTILDQILLSEVDKMRIKNSIREGYYEEAVLESLNIWQGYGHEAGAESADLTRVLQGQQLNALAVIVGRLLDDAAVASAGVQTFSDGQWPFRTLKVLGAGSFGIVINVESELDGS